MDETATCRLEFKNISKSIFKILQCACSTYFRFYKDCMNHLQYSSFLKNYYDLIASGPISESFQSHSRYGRPKISDPFEIRLVNDDCSNGMENYKWYYRNSILLNMAVSYR